MLQCLENGYLRQAGGHFVVGSEHHAFDSATKVRTIDALAGRGEEHLLDELFHMRRVVGLFLQAAERSVDGHRVSDAGERPAHLLDTFVCVEEMTTGPWGGRSALIHKPWLAWLSVGAPALASSSLTVLVTIMEGLGVGGTVGRVKGQPAIVKVSAGVAI